MISLNVFNGTLFFIPERAIKSGSPLCINANSASLNNPKGSPICPSLTSLNFLVSENSSLSRVAIGSTCSIISSIDPLLQNVVHSLNIKAFTRHDCNLCAACDQSGDIVKNTEPFRKLRYAPSSLWLIRASPLPVDDWHCSLISESFTNHFFRCSSKSSIPIILSCPSSRAFRSLIHMHLATLTFKYSVVLAVLRPEQSVAKGT